MAEENDSRGSMKKLGRAVKRYREAARLTVDDVARTASVTPKFVSRLEAGLIDSPDFLNVIAVGKALGLNPTTLVELAITHA